jgi:hypothetical protein
MKPANYHDVDRNSMLPEYDGQDLGMQPPSSAIMLMNLRVFERSEGSF